MVETVIGCKWSLTVLDLVEQGIVRPGEMERSVEGLTAKVLNDCLRRLVQFKVLDKRSYPELPPRVEYGLTEFGWKFRGTLDALDALEADFVAAGTVSTTSCPVDTGSPLLHRAAARAPVEPRKS
jgi:DNA-binding HxlR family transcriptional regulator